MRGFFRENTPKPIWNALRVGKYFAMDAFDVVSGRWDLPPRELVASIGGDFTRAGNEFLGYLKKYGALEPGDCALDVGCGVGRMAMPLTKYLSKSGSYDGFDIVPRAIEWCSNNITPRYPNFRFYFADIYNKHYNPNGRLRAADFRFPYDDGKFDLVFLTSVFTHMLQNDVEHYLSEISRVLKLDGRCLITWLLLNEESKQLIERGNSSLAFLHQVGRSLTVDKDDPEKAVAYEEADVLKFYARQGLRLTRPIYYGSWCGRSEYLSYQDISIGYKSRADTPF
jgi:SAM-dependent methyltransferase